MRSAGRCSSAAPARLWPFSAAGWAEESEALSTPSRWDRLPAGASPPTPPSPSRSRLAARRPLCQVCNDEDEDEDEDDDEDDGGWSAMVAGVGSGLRRCALRGRGGSEQGALGRRANGLRQTTAREHAAAVPQRHPRPAQRPATCTLRSCREGTARAGASAASASAAARATWNTERPPPPQLTIHGAEQHQSQDGRGKLGKKERGAERGSGQPPCCSLWRARVHSCLAAATIGRARRRLAQRRARAVTRMRGTDA